MSVRLPSVSGVTVAVNIKSWLVTLLLVEAVTEVDRRAEDRFAAGKRTGATGEAA